MSHEITVREDGTAEAAYANIPAWHRLGVTVDHAMTSEEAIVLAQLGYRVVQLPLEAIDGDGRIALPKYFANVREDTKDVLGVVGSRYEILQNCDAFNFCDSLVMDGILKYEAAFSLKGGKQIVLLARMPGADTVADGDTLEKFILFFNSHDGSKAVNVFGTSVRTVCANTLRLAFHNASKANVFSIRHTPNMDQRIKDARKMLGLASDTFEHYADQARKLVKVKLSVQQFADYLDAVVPLPDKKGRQLTRINDVRNNIMVNYHADRRQAVGEIKETAWAAFNAVSQEVDHSKPARDAGPETKFLTTTFGSGNDLKQRAWTKALEMVGVGN